jgi:hypothetical protein
MANQTETSLFSLQTLELLWRALTVRDDDKLKAWESASTLFRFFRSKHVIDLKAIFFLAISILVIHLVVAVYLIKQAHASDPHTVDTYLGAAVPIYGAIIAWAYLNAGKRLGVVDLFACEIGTLCRVSALFDVGRYYVDLYLGEGDIKDKHPKAKHLATHHATSESSGTFVSQEKYFPIFDNNSSDLQSLEALVVGSITEFYTYMKAARDLQRKLASIVPTEITQPAAPVPGGSGKEDSWHETLANLIYVLFLGFESARKSIKDLIEFEPTRAENSIIILLTELVCFSFLCEYLKDSEIRVKDLERHELATGGKDALKLKRLGEEFEVKFRRLELRAAEYEDLVPALIARVNDDHGESENYWLPAKRTVPELQNRFDAATEALKRCRAKDAAAAAAATAAAA